VDKHGTATVDKLGTATHATQDNVMLLMPFACWAIKAIYTYSECVILIAFTRERWLRERELILRYKYLTCIFF
jgi:hypothetical protein